MYIKLLKNRLTNELSMINDERIEKVFFNNKTNALLDIINNLQTIHDDDNDISTNEIYSIKNNKFTLYKAKIINNINDVQDKKHNFLYMLKDNNVWDFYAMDKNGTFNPNFKKYINKELKEFYKINQWIYDCNKTKIYYVELIDEII